MSADYRRLKSYQEVRGDRRTIANATGEVKVECRITSKMGKRTVTTTEIGHSTGGPISEPSTLRALTNRAIDDAIAHHVQVRGGDADLTANIPIKYDPATQTVMRRDHKILNVTVLQRWIRYRIPKNQRIKRERWKNKGYRVVRREQGRFVNSVPYNTVNKGRDLESYEYNPSDGDIDTLI